MGKCRCNNTRRGNRAITNGFDPFATLPQLTAAAGFEPDNFENEWCGFIAYRARIQYDGPFFAGTDCRLLDNGGGAAIIDGIGDLIDAGEEVIERRRCPYYPCGCGCYCQPKCGCRCHCGCH